MLPFRKEPHGSPLQVGAQSGIIRHPTLFKLTALTDGLVYSEKLQEQVAGQRTDKGTLVCGREDTSREHIHVGRNSDAGKPTGTM
ncbi:hypothetical protein MHYP_G00303690 [Metynnis hypsauchen]